MRTIRTASGDSDSVIDRVDREQAVDHEADQDRVRDGARADPSAEHPREREHDHRDDDVRGAERHGRALRDTLVEHVPGREAELGLEEEHDSERKENKADDERGRTDDDRAANEGRCVHRISVRANSARGKRWRSTNRATAPISRRRAAWQPPCGDARRGLLARRQPRHREGPKGRQRQRSGCVLHGARVNQS